MVGFFVLVEHYSCSVGVGYIDGGGPRGALEECTYGLILERRRCWTS